MNNTPKLRRGLYISFYVYKGKKGVTRYWYLAIEGRRYKITESAAELLRKIVKHIKQSPFIWECDNPNCSRTFYRSRSQYLTSHQHFCSKKCSSQVKHPPVSSNTDEIFQTYIRYLRSEDHTEDENRFFIQRRKLRTDKPDQILEDQVAITTDQVFREVSINEKDLLALLKSKFGKRKVTTPFNTLQQKSRPRKKKNIRKAQSSPVISEEEQFKIFCHFHGIMGERKKGIRVISRIFHVPEIIIKRVLTTYKLSIPIEKPVSSERGKILIPVWMLETDEENNTKNSE